ncbi:hypothetical protein NUM3379_40660 [Kineococcus sp. NUM-3379]
MSAPVTAAATAVLAALLALASAAPTAVLVVVVAALGVLLAVGWPPLLALPTPRGSTAVVGAAALASAAVVGATAGRGGDDGPLASLPATMALAVLAAFAHQLLRRDGRPRLVESVSSVAAGQAVVVGAAAWVAVPLAAGGVRLSLAAAAAVAVAAALCTLPLPLRTAGPCAVVLGAGAGWLVHAVGAAGPAGRGLLAACAVGAVAGAVVAAWRTLVAPLPAVRGRRASLAVAAAPVALCGPGTYVLGRLLLG